MRRTEAGPITGAVPTTSSSSSSSFLSSSSAISTIPETLPQYMELAKAPITNVWNARMEQMAARATSSGIPASSSSPSAPITPTPSTRQPSSGTPSSKGQASVPAATVNVPPMTDKESWPEVTASLAKDGSGGKEKEGENVKEQRPKKAEKAKKWVPIPAEELQAAADALKASTSNRRHSSSKGDHPRDKSSSRKNPSGSQQGGNRGTHRKDHPNSGLNSQVASTSHSRVQSRSGSVHSSPRGAGRRRLPEDRRDRDPNSNTASPRVNGVRSLGPSDDGKDKTLKPTNPSTSSTRSSKPSSPHPAGDFQSYPNNSSLPPSQFLPAAHMTAHGLPPPSHLYPPHQFHPHLAVYGGGYPPAPGVPYGVNPLGGHPLLPPSPGSPYGERTGDSTAPGEEKANSLAYPSVQHYTAPPYGVASSYPSNSELVHYQTSGAVQPQAANGRISDEEKAIASTNNKHTAGSVQFGSIDLSTLTLNEPVEGPSSNSHTSCNVNGVAATPATLVNGAPSGRVIAIGVSPDDLPGTGRGVKAAGSTTSGATAGKAGRRSRRPSLAVPVTGEDQEPAGDGKAKWEFGTTAVAASSSAGDASGSRLDVVVEDHGNLARLSPLSMSLSASPNAQPPVGLAPSNPPGPSLQPTEPPGLSPPVGESNSGNTQGDVPLGAHENQHIPSGAQRPPGSSESADQYFEVRDFGYGFGRASGSGRAVELAREEMVAREREREWERSKHQTLQQGQIQGQGQPSQPQQHQGPSRDGRYGYGDRERGNRGGPRRDGGRGGRGGPGGLPNRNARRGNAPPPGPHNIPHNQNPHFNPNAPPHHLPFMPPPLHLPLQSPPGVFTHDGMPSPTAYYGGLRPGYVGLPPGPPLPPSGTVSFLPPPPPLPPHLLPPHPISGPPSAISPTASAGPAPSTSGAGPAEPPVPVPMTAIRFPLDPTRYYLLGQLEYYLSPQNMAMDFFLRQQMDSLGWIPISLIASFNRVRRLTTDLNLVKEVLFLSSMVQVREDWVRMGNWQRFVLPDAAESIVPEDPKMPVELPVPVDGGSDGSVGSAFVVRPPPEGYLFNSRVPFNVEEGAPIGYGQMPAPQHYKPEASMPAYAQGAESGEQPGEDDEDEEDDVVFVMGANGQ